MIKLLLNNKLKKTEEEKQPQVDRNAGIDNQIITSVSGQRKDKKQADQKPTTGQPSI